MEGCICGGRDINGVSLAKFQKMSNLKYLNLTWSLGLAKIPNFGDMPNLETLDLDGCVNLEEVHPSLGHCRMLTYVSLWGCVELKKLPKFVYMESLETLNLLGCTSLQKFPEICGDMQRLSMLYVGSPWIRTLPSSLCSLRDLELTDCEILESIPDCIRNLERLRISGCNKLATLPNSLFESQQLENITIYGCSGLIKLPISFGVQKQLRCLEIEICENLKKLPSIIQMESLGELTISECPKLDTFPEIKGDMHWLNKLALHSTGIREVPSFIWHLTALKSLSLGGYKILDDLQELKILDARETAIFHPPSSITKLGKLRELSFSHDERQCQHSSSFVLYQLSALSSLRELDLSNRNILGGLPEDLGSLQFLEKLNVSGSDISCLPKSINKLSQLHLLNIQFCQNLNELPGELPPNLKELFADHHLALKSIRDLAICCLKLCRLFITDSGAVSSEQVNVFLQHFCRTCIQCDFNQRDYFVISFRGVRIPVLFDYQFIDQKEISVDLNPSWYTDKFMGFWISYGPTTLSTGLEATLVCKSDYERKYSLKYRIICKYSRLEDPSICCFYIPFERLWRYASGNKEGKNPNDYYMLELSHIHRKELYWGICLEYEKEAMTDIVNKKKRRKI